MTDPSPHPVERIRLRRRVTGMAAVLLPFTDAGEVDWPAFVAHVERTAAAGLVPAVNMDTGYVQLIDAATRTRVLDETRRVVDRFVAGAHVADREGATLDVDAYRREMEAIARRGGLPIVFPSHGLNALDGPGWVEAQADIATAIDEFLAFELGPMFVPYGRIYDLGAYRSLLDVPQCVGAKHSSLSRRREWDRLEVRDAVRPEFLVLTGNDLAIDMIIYGSDYLLGLATFAPDLFARRDRMWAEGDPDFYELDDALAYLGAFAFREPVPAYRHSAAQMLALRGWIGSDATPPGAPRRPDSDVAVLAGIGRRLGIL